MLAAADPAQPYGAALPWPKRAGARAARVAGAHVVLLGGEAALFVERGGRSLVPLREPEEEWLRVALAALVAHVKRGGAKRLAVERFDGEPVVETSVMPLLSRPASSPARGAPCCAPRQTVPMPAAGALHTADRRQDLVATTSRPGRSRRGRSLGRPYDRCLRSERAKAGANAERSRRPDRTRAGMA